MSSAIPSVVFPCVDAKEHRVEGFDKLNYMMLYECHDLSSGFVIMINRMTKGYGLLSNNADRCVRLG